MRCIRFSFCLLTRKGIAGGCLCRVPAKAGGRRAIFSALFSMSDPRLEYPQISDAVWNNIVNTRVADGMTKQEVSLAIGMPESIDRGYNQNAAYERWNYPDGRYLLFEDGLLMRFNR